MVIGWKGEVLSRSGDTTAVREAFGQITTTAAIRPQSSESSEIARCDTSILR